MVDADLAAFYGVSTKRLNEQVKRNRERFPEDFMFQLDASRFLGVTLGNDAGIEYVSVGRSGFT